MYISHSSRDIVHLPRQRVCHIHSFIIPSFCTCDSHTYSLMIKLPILEGSYPQLDLPTYLPT
jgi:hypothetical protein